MGNSSSNQLEESKNRLNRNIPIPRPFNPLYDGRTGNASPTKINFWYLVPVLCVLIFLYLKSQENDPSDDKFKQDRVMAEGLNDNLLFDESGYPIGEKGTKTDPKMGMDTVYRPRNYAINSTISSTKNTDNYAYENVPNRRKYKQKTPRRTILTDIDGIKNSLVFAGSFVNPDNAERLVTHLRTIGYEKAEIVMKENLPYKVVITGFSKQQNTAKNEVKALEKRGIDGYSTTDNLDEIYRNKKQ